MMEKLYYKYWGKAENDALKVAYCSGSMTEKEIFEKFKSQLAKNLKKLECELQLSDLDIWAKQEDKKTGKEKWEYEQADYAAYHLLPYHCLDVAAVADAWWESSQSLRQQFKKTMKVDNPQQAKAWVMFFVALHDLGKLDIRFQMKAKETAIQLQPDLPQNIKQVRTDYYHGDAGYAWFLYESRGYGFNPSVEDQAIAWMTQVAGHHGIIPISRQDKQQISGVSPLLIARDRQARIDWINDLKELFSVDLNADPKNVPPLLAGFCSVCDWVGSSDYFDYETKPNIALADYLASRSDKAKRALQTFGILSQLTTNKTLETLFPLYKPRGLQTLTEQLPSAQNLTLIEAPTGSGKTETALVYAARLLQQGLADSIIFALPTQATANAMLDRLEAMAGNLFVEGANVVLAHGKSSLRLEKILETQKQTAQGQEEATQQAAQWLTASKKRAFLGQIGVCTIDQVLLSVLPVKHKFVRSFGIQKSVLIVDEVHAYDSYMYGLLEAVLKQQYQAHGSALLLSATLPQQQREALARSWQTEIEITKTYPLITQIYADKTSKAFELLDTQQLPKPRTVHLETWALADLQFTDDSLTKIIAAAKQDAKVAVICNLVADAQDLAQRLKEHTDIEDIEVDLFHSRFRFIDRQQKEETVKALYGKDNAKRAVGGRILVATQVVEQSLDLDFDWMITQLCPVDLLFQRLGRLHRHERDKSERPINFREPHCVVIMPEHEGGYGYSGKVYKNVRVLWRTQQLVSKNASVIFPEAYRDWIEQVYQDEAWQDESLTLTATYEKYKDEVQGVAKMTATWVTELQTTPLSDEDDRAAMLTRDGEMSLTILPVLERQNKFYTLENEWIDEENKKYWQQVSLNSVCVPNSWNKYEKLFANCAKKDGVIYLVMQKTAEGVWQAELGKETLLYSVQQGLERIK